MFLKTNLYFENLHEKDKILKIHNLYLKTFYLINPIQITSKKMSCTKLLLSSLPRILVSYNLKLLYLYPRFSFLFIFFFLPGNFVTANLFIFLFIFFCWHELVLYLFIELIFSLAHLKSLVTKIKVMGMVTLIIS